MHQTCASRMLVLSVGVLLCSGWTRPGASSLYAQTVDDSAPSTQDSSTQDSNHATPASLALRAMFSTLDVPERKTMGLLQRNFLEMAGGGDSELEVALVIDGTDSMSAELAGVRQSVDRMLADLRRFRSKEIRTAIVVFRDSGSKSGEVSLALKEFTSDEKRIADAVAAISPESGEPFFHELPDVGVHQAITELPWSDDPSVTKWIMLFGDAPPYDTGMQDPKHPKARRRYADALLVSLARNRGIQINSILCTSGAENSESFATVIDQTRGFMSRLSTETSGVMLDLSYEAIQEALVKAGNRPSIQFQSIAPITEADLLGAKRIDNAGPTGEVNIAVIPHEPLSTVQFDPRRESVQVSTAIRHRFAQLPGVRTASPVKIQRQLRRLRAEGLADEQTLRGLAGRLGVDYVVWGNVQPQIATVQTAAYRRTDGEAVVQVAFDGERGKLTDVILSAAATKTDTEEALGQLARRVQNNSNRAILQTPIAENSATAAELLSAIESLDQALAYRAGSEESVSLLKSASQSAGAAADAEPRNPIAHWLRAGANFNLAAHQFGTGDAATAKNSMLEFKSALRRAEREVDRAESSALATEIRADHALLIRNEVDRAIELYGQLTAHTMPLSSQLRGHWMLAGIHAGDWGVAGSVVDLEKSREHVIEILANWPESPQAVQLKQWLLWDDSSDQTKHNFLPLINSELGKMTGA